MDSCFDLAGSRQHGVAEKSKATGWLTYRLLNANGNDRKMKLKSKCLRDPGQYAKSRISCQLSQKGDCGQTKTVPQKINGQTVLKLSCISDRKRPFGQNENAAGVPVINMPAMFSFVVPSSHYCIKTKVFLPLLLWGFLYGLHGVIFTKTWQTKRRPKNVALLKKVSMESVVGHYIFFDLVAFFLVHNWLLTLLNWQNFT